MKKILATILLLAVFFTGCTKKPAQEQTKSHENSFYYKALNELTEYDRNRFSSKNFVEVKDCLFYFYNNEQNNRYEIVAQDLNNKEITAVIHKADKPINRIWILSKTVIRFCLVDKTVKENAGMKWYRLDLKTNEISEDPFQADNIDPLKVKDRSWVRIQSVEFDLVICESNGAEKNKQELTDIYIKTRKGDYYKLAENVKKYKVVGYDILCLFANKTEFVQISLMDAVKKR